MRKVRTKATARLLLTGALSLLCAGSAADTYILENGGTAVLCDKYVGEWIKTPDVQ